MLSRKKCLNHILQSLHTRLNQTIFHLQSRMFSHLVIDEVDDGMFQHLGRFGQPLYSGGLVRVHLCGGDGYPLL